MNFLVMLLQVHRQRTNENLELIAIALLISNADIKSTALIEFDANATATAS